MAYPDTYDALATNKGDSTASVTDHAGHHNALADAINRIETELGLSPSDTWASVAARLTDHATKAYVDAVAAGGILLGREQITTPPALTTSGTPVPITGLTVPVTIAARPVIVLAYTYALYNNSTGDAVFAIHRDGTDIPSQIQMGQTLALGANKGGPALVAQIDQPSAGAHTYNATIRRGVTGSAGIGAASSAPAWLAVIQV